MVQLFVIESDKGLQSFHTGRKEAISEFEQLEEEFPDEEFDLYIVGNLSHLR